MQRSPSFRSRLIWLAVSALALAALHAQQAKNEDVQALFKKWLNEDVAYIITEPERAVFLSLATVEEKEHFIEQVWQRRDPTPGTPQNDFKEEHYRRIQYANERFAAGRPGLWGGTGSGHLEAVAIGTLSPPSKQSDGKATSRRRRSPFGALCLRATRGPGLWDCDGGIATGDISPADPDQGQGVRSGSLC